MIMYRQWMVFMSLVIDLIGQLNCVVGSPKLEFWKSLRYLAKIKKNCFKI